MPQIRNAPTQERSRQTLDSIMEASDRLFERKGVDGATNTEIAEEAGCSIGSLYRFFPNKEALVFEYIARYTETLAANVSPLPDELSLDELDEIVSVLVDRSIATRSVFRGYERVRLWRYPDGSLASASVRDAELAMVQAMFHATSYELDDALIQRMALVIVDGTWPLITGLNDMSKADRAAMTEEIKFSLSSYIRARVTPLID